MFCMNCGAELTVNGNFCPYCGAGLETASASASLISKAVSTAQDTNHYNLVLVSRGSCDAVTAGDLLEDVFGYTDAESGNLVKMAPVVVGENLTEEEAGTIAQMYTEYGMQVSITDDEDRFVDLEENAVNSVFDNRGSLLAGAAAIIGALTVANRISAYRRFRKPSLPERTFRLRYTSAKPVYHRNFRPRLDPKAAEPRKAIRRPAAPNKAPMNRTPSGRSGFGGTPSGSHGGAPGHGGSSGHGGHGGPGGRR